MGIRCVHYVGFKDDRFLTAYRAFGGPVFIHRSWDKRGQREIGENDLVVFANGPADQSFSEYNAPDIIEPEPLPVPEKH
ncbi:MAG: hypothetical protein AAGM67_14540 [Bacteroidota bacterium]